MALLPRSREFRFQGVPAATGNRTLIWGECRKAAQEERQLALRSQVVALPGVDRLQILGCRQVSERPLSHVIQV